MSVAVSDCVDVIQRAEELGLALTASLVILPRGFGTAPGKDHLMHEADASTLRKLLAAEGLDVQQLEPQGGHFPSVIQRSAAWLAPTVFVGSLLISQNPYAVQVALNVVASYAHDMLRKGRTSRQVKVTFIIERRKSRKYAQVEYEGPVSELPGLAKLLRDVHDEQ